MFLGPFGIHSSIREIDQSGALVVTRESAPMPR